MDFGHSDKIQTIVAMIKEFVAAELIPLEPEFLVKDFSKMLPVIREKQEMVKKMELWAPNFPVECGGMGLSLLEHGLVSEALGYSPLGHYVFWCQARMPGTWKFCMNMALKNKNSATLILWSEVRSDPVLP